MRYFILLFIIVALSSCDVSKMSSKDAQNIGLLNINIFIEDGTKDSDLNQIKVKLTDGKKQVINEDIKILLNGFPLDLYVKNELYYTKTSFYRTDSLSRRDSYYFEIILPDSTTYPLAFIKPQKNNKSAKFNIPDRISYNEDYTIQWTNLNIPHQLEILKGTKVKKKRAENITEMGYSGRITDTLNTRVGKYVIPKSYFIDSLTTTTRIEITFNRTENGLVNPKLLKNSDIQYQYTLEKAIHFD